MTRRPVLALVLSSSAAFAPLACARQADLQSEPGRGYVLETTGAELGRDDPARNDPTELPPLALAPTVAGRICDREIRCHDDPSRASPCMHAYLRRATAEIGSWQCSPAAARARIKACLAAIDVEPCELDRSTRPLLCATNAACPE
jgi:hypothetical protein